MGVYEYEPHFRVDNQGNMSGYYYDFMKLLQEKLPFEYEFIVIPLSEGFNKLNSGEIDIMLGFAMNTKFEDNFLFNRYCTNKEQFGVLSDEPVDLEKLANMKQVKIGIVEGDANAE